MEKGTYQIKESGHDEASMFSTVFGFLGERDSPKEGFYAPFSFTYCG